MSVTASTLRLEHGYADALPELAVPWTAAPFPAARVLVRNDGLAAELGVDPAALTPALLTGAELPEGATPAAQAYAGHQFGGWSPRLGDGRALLLGEVTDAHGRPRDVALKGSGRTPFARGGDGKAAVGPMLREHLTSEAMHALGIPTTRALAVVATGETVMRETPLPGALVVRVAASHLRVGSFQYAAAQGDRALLRRLADHAIDRHHPDAWKAEDPYLALFEAVLEVQAALVARWMHVGFVHGVLNTDNVTISGETIDYGPCAFLDAYDPHAVFSSIDHGGRYAFGNQPGIVQWDLARLAEALLPLIEGDAAGRATAVLQTFPERFSGHWHAGMRAKLGVVTVDTGLVNDLLGAMHAAGTDWTRTLRALAEHLRGGPDPLPDWTPRWRALDPDADAMDAVNPVVVPRNHRVEDALAAATDGDLGPYERLLDAVTHPHDAPADPADALPAPPELPPYRTFCGT